MTEKFSTEIKEFPSGWFKCAQCNFFIILEGSLLWKARKLKQTKKPIICSTCDPEKGLKPAIRRKEERISGFIFDDY